MAGESKSMLEREIECMRIDLSDDEKEVEDSRKDQVGVFYGLFTSFAWFNTVLGPVNVGETKSSTTLSTSCQPFALDDLANPTLFDYRLFSTSYRPLPSDQSVVDDPLATAFLTRFPQVVLDLRKIAHNGSPLVNKAVDCGLTCLILLPVFHHPLRHRSYSTYSCVGVVECCINVPPLVPPLLRSLDLELKRVCLSTYHVQPRLTYEVIYNLVMTYVFWIWSTLVLPPRKLVFHGSPRKLVLTNTQCIQKRRLANTKT
uniref:uncharacterized protein LOC122591062 n=1 Tax=Erigeron canadensis TaxID=72917 RepID=UPI001CB8B5B4|nr:uncharacterized protein LOC122591062 [Erigeron canadensis]